MPNSKSIVEHALDLLVGLGPVQARSMFGGHGLYARAVMFGVIVDDEVYLKTDEACRETFVKAGCQPWIHRSRRGALETSYLRPPDDAFEEPEAMLPWAQLALEAALRKRAAQAKPARADRGAATSARKRARGRKTPSPRARR